MRFKSLLLTGAVPLVALALAAPAAAGEARASGNVPVRDCPRSFCPVIDHLVDDEYYEVLECTRQARWCLVADDGEELGWVRGSAIVGSPAKAAVTPFEPLVTPRFPFMQN
ncbi:MAG TPA: SH3 domain-containing protein [Alphaproteobacteria bacterium]|nr:SH3 domain-containing protein [Alphaproteobacteria bacterium]